MATYKLNDWTFDIAYDTAKPVAWVYRNIKNHHYSFAKEIAIERIVVEVEDDAGAREVSLAYSDFCAVNAAEQIELPDEAAHANDGFANFAVYQGKAIRLRMKTRRGRLPATHGANGQAIESPLFLMIAFRFGRYGNDPPHEFSGALTAARFTPAVRFATKNRAVKSIRIHYRFQFALESYLDHPWTDKQSPPARNYAAIIRDADSFPPSFVGLFNLLRELLEFDAGRIALQHDLARYAVAPACRATVDALSLEIVAEAPTWALNVSFQPLSRATTSTFGDKAQQLDIDEYSASYKTVIESLVADIAAIVPVTDACVTTAIRYCLTQVVYQHYCRNRCAAIAKLRSETVSALPPDAAAILEALAPGTPSGLQAALARYLDLARLLLTPTASIIAELGTLVGKLVSVAAFDAAEKPALFEAVGRFVDKGLVTTTWDNLHWWGTEELPSAPGAFFAIHSHFRWTRLNTYPTEAEATILWLVNLIAGTHGELYLGAPQLRSAVKGSLYGPLIDPEVPTQTIEFAIAKQGGALDCALLSLHGAFETLPASSKIEQIASLGQWGNTGSDIAYWVSCKAERTSSDSGTAMFHGTLMINGFYFAHDEEKPFSLTKPANSFDVTRGGDVQKPLRTVPGGYTLFRAP